VTNTHTSPRLNGWLQRAFPFLGWIGQLRDTSVLRADLVAGLTVALVAIPQSLAYAQLSGVPAYYGLYATLIPVVVGALFGSSLLLSTGPVAMTSLLTAASIMPLATYGTNQFYAYVILMALLSGLVQIGLGLARMGMLLNFLSYPVLRGFINAAAIIIGLSQLPPLVGLSLKNSAHFLQRRVSCRYQHRCHAPLVAHLRYRRSRLDDGFEAIHAATAGRTDYRGAHDLHQLRDRFRSGWRQGGRCNSARTAGISIPPVEWKATLHMLPTAFVIAIISFMEAMSSSKIIAIQTRTRWNENQELIGQGLAKVAAAFSHAMPVSGSFSRSALNLAAGARTGMSSVFTALAVLLTLLFFTPFLHHLPKPVLAAIIMMAVISLINFGTIKEAWVAGKADGIAAIVTFVATLVFAPNIQNGILTGITLSLALFLFRTMKPRIVLLG